VKARSAPPKLGRDFDVAETRQVVAEIGNPLQMREAKEADELGEAREMFDDVLERDFSFFARRERDAIIDAHRNHFAYSFLMRCSNFATYRSESVREAALHAA
jgi:hypothetical protein